MSDSTLVELGKELANMDGPIAWVGIVLIVAVVGVVLYKKVAKKNA